jgi:uncharacterized protein YodC (DUF2158 family)
MEPNAESPFASKFKRGDVVRQKTGGPLMTVCDIDAPDPTLGQCNFHVGDKVTMNSGGTPMTVAEISTAVWCRSVDHNGKEYITAYSPVCLKLAPSSTPDRLAQP